MNLEEQEQDYKQLISLRERNNDIPKELKDLYKLIFNAARLEIQLYEFKTDQKLLMNYVHEYKKKFWMSLTDANKQSVIREFKIVFKKTQDDIWFSAGTSPIGLVPVLFQAEGHLPWSAFRYFMTLFKYTDEKK